MVGPLGVAGAVELSGHRRLQQRGDLRGNASWRAAAKIAKGTLLAAAVRHADGMGTLGPWGRTRFPLDTAAQFAPWAVREQGPHSSRPSRTQAVWSSHGTSFVVLPALPLHARFEKHFPDRTFDVGIAEQHAVTFAAGLACEGLVPFCTIYSTFMQRGYDQIVHDVSLQKLPGEGAATGGAGI